MRRIEGGKAKEENNREDSAERQKLTYNGIWSSLQRSERYTNRLISMWQDQCRSNMIIQYQSTKTPSLWPRWSCPLCLHTSKLPDTTPGCKFWRSQVGCVCLLSYLSAGKSVKLTKIIYEKFKDCIIRLFGSWVRNWYEFYSLIASVLSGFQYSNVWLSR